jgi:hypothetical protein
MNLSELVKMRGFDINKKIKLVRHKEKGFDINSLYKQGLIDIYQSIQSKDVFRDCDVILSFIGIEESKAVYIGAYEIGTKLNFNKENIPEYFPYKDMFVKDFYYQYQLNKINLLEDMVDRLVINWGKSTINWQQWINKDKPKQIIEVLPQGYVKDFPGFDEIILTYDELKTIVKNPDANKVWHTMLASVSGVYLIVDMTDGSQYVRSAYGKNGILGRWNEYVDKKHGGNAKLEALLIVEPNRYYKFQFTVLRTLPKSMMSTQVIAYEQMYKQKLGSKVFGFNGN